ncbi:glutamine-hydrolyzing carbamoyl-phosphate synthase small subunit [Granulosicoccus antarcticus]|uniref:Carbamoyl phosphate synthase small chain n=1 Tax=Granulosicoccus antarcticus IMCC3135 TaxID=1192854 RepID=A0A2Z2NPJ6_9GAMM|nr:glutamine-hydrolyzing carbamoyl-phosphate synthase small subunit [Granulosicoccus antarcticus]ASJ72385.1 Carbamoyl-phosphate synthase small chain [Granulosicoccus antarcticus IMCC3135]
MSRPAILVLADGTCFDGIAIGIDGLSVGEVVFNTAMTGYQEILTDPSYAQQIVTLTYPHIGNTGANTEDMESDSVHCKGLVIRDLPRLHSNFRAEQSLEAFLEQHKVVAISDIDTRALTRHLRDKGAQNGCILAGDHLASEQGRAAGIAAAREAATGFPGLAGMDLAKEVTCDAPYEWTKGTWSLDPSTHTPPVSLPGRHIVAMDFGVKQNILRLFIDRGCTVTVVPATWTAQQIRELKPDGLFLSNGPGDPEPCDYAIQTITELLAERLPTFGICLGHQLLALASGARSVKMKFGHHGANHPVLDIATGRVMISSQNHGFAVDADSLDNTLAITHTSLFDNSLQGIRRLDVPALGFQGHPEASPGPHDVVELFDDFLKLLPAA